LKGNFHDQFLGEGGTATCPLLPDMFGEVTQTVGTLASDFQYAGYYFHAPSGLNLTTYRAYNPTLGRWISRDPIEEDGGLNLHGYVQNTATTATDRDGLWLIPGTRFCGPGSSSGRTSGKFAESSPDMPMFPGDDGFRPPISPLDSCCYIHDLCMHYAHSIKDNGSRRRVRCWCDSQLARCALRSGSLLTPEFALVFYSRDFGMHVIFSGDYGANPNLPEGGATPNLPLHGPL